MEDRAPRCMKVRYHLPGVSTRVQPDENPPRSTQLTSSETDRASPEGCDSTLTDTPARSCPTTRIPQQAPEAQERHELGPGVLHNRTIAGYLRSQMSLNSANRSNAAASDGAVYTGFRSFATAAQSFFEAYRNEFRSRCTMQVWVIVAGPHLPDRVGQALQPVADQDQAHVGHAPVLDLGQDPQPELRALAVAVLPGPQPQDVPVPSTVTASAT